MKALEDLSRRLRRTDLLLLRAVQRQRARPAMQLKGQYWGSLVDDQEVVDILFAHGELDAPPGPDELDAEVALSTSLRDAPGGRFAELSETFGLDGDERDLLLLALAPELSAGYARVLAYLNDNLNQAYLTVDLATRVLRSRREERLELLSRLLGPSPLVRHRLFLLQPEEGAEPFPARRLQLAPSVLHWLLGGRLRWQAGVSPLDTREEPFVPAPTAARVEALGDALLGPVTVVVVGGTQGAREGTAQAIARRAGRPLLRVELDRARELLARPQELVRDLRLSRSIPYLVNVEVPEEDPALRNQLLALGAALAELPYPVLAGGADRRSVAALLGTDRPALTVQVHRSTRQEREAAWARALERRGWPRSLAGDLPERFYAVGGTSIDRILDRASSESGGGPPGLGALWAAAREESRPEFRGLALHVVPRYTFGDLVLPEKVLQQLRQLVSFVTQQETVFHRWGMSRVRARGFGVKALFTGEPGTGKTMAAEVVAGALGLDLFRVDLSSVISRWVGETEKNLREIFDAAEGGTAVILFDEADALFGARGEVKQAQDRFANQEVSFLLQRLEVFEGCAILTTNLQENIDEAFQRRFGSVIEFPMPSVAERRRLWQRALPRSVPRDEEIDLDFLAQRFDLSGGSIVNAAIHACVLAADAGGGLRMEHVLRAVARELVKMGKQVNRVRFGDWYPLVADT